MVFSNNGPFVNETHTVSTAPVIVTLAGNYQIEYNISITLGVGLEIAIAVGGIRVAATSVQNGDPDDDQIIGNAILILAAGDLITLINDGSLDFFYQFSFNKIYNMFNEISEKITFFIYGNKDYKMKACQYLT